MKYLVAGILLRRLFGRRCFRRRVLPNTYQNLTTTFSYSQKNKSKWNRNLLPRTAEQNKAYKNPDNDPRGPWTSGDLSARNFYGAGTYSITTPKGRVIEGPPKGMYWRVSKSKFDELDADNRIWWGKEGDNQPRLKRFLSDVMDGVVPQTIWPHKEVGNTQEAKKEVIAAIPDAELVFQTAKPERLLQADN